MLSKILLHQKSHWLQQAVIIEPNLASWHSLLILKCSKTAFKSWELIQSGSFQDQVCRSFILYLNEGVPSREDEENKVGTMQKRELKGHNY